jgi:hypothetical protein
MKSLPMIEVRPAQGRRVRDPEGGVLPPEGARVPENTFWLRRIQDGDVVLVSAELSRRKGRGEQ